MQAIKGDESQEFGVPRSLQVVVGIIYHQRAGNILDAFRQKVRLQDELCHRQADHDYGGPLEWIIFSQQKVPSRIPKGNRVSLFVSIQ